jgi:hypothetical protein
MPKREPILNDATQLTAGQLIVCDGVVKTAPITGTIAAVKTAMGASVIRACDIAARRGANLSSSKNSRRTKPRPVAGPAAGQPTMISS